MNELADSRDSNTNECVIYEALDWDKRKNFWPPPPMRSAHDAAACRAVLPSVCVRGGSVAVPAKPQLPTQQEKER